MSRTTWNAEAREWIRRAILAPSSHDTQPWLFRIGEEMIELRADRSRALPANDPDDRELTISCGAALMTLRAAAATTGIALRVARLPDDGGPDLLARVTADRGAKASADDAALATAIERRRTHRKPFASGEVDPSITGPLVQAAAVEDAWLRPLESDEARRRVGALVEEGDAAQWADPAWRRELAAWMRPRSHGDGLPVPTLAAPITRFVVRTFDMGRSVGAKDRRLAETAPLLALLGTEGDTPREWLRCGEALQRVLLTACTRGLQAAYLNQPNQVPSVRAKLRDAVGGGAPQVVLRIGRPAEDLPAAPRRPVEDVIVPPPPDPKGLGRR